MGLIEDHKIEAAVARAMEQSASATALALVQIAADPENYKARMAELTTATAAADEARAAAEAATADAERAKADAETKLAELTERETVAHREWISEHAAQT